MRNSRIGSGGLVDIFSYLFDTVDMLVLSSFSAPTARVGDVVWKIDVCLAALPLEHLITSRSVVWSILVISDSGRDPVCC